ncbi:hypothetical protein B9Z55_025366 [Caenorhabditis nigoni]|nr:hypothetical protein B9Z55_025366 [Caenorhabditis nigoni]
MVRFLLITVLFATSSSLTLPLENKFLNSIRKLFGQSPECTTELRKFNECVDPYVGFIRDMDEEINANSKILYQFELMTTVSKITKNISTCFGYEVQCKMSKLVAFALDAADFVVNKVYGDAFSCFQDSNIIELNNNLCVETDNLKNDFRTMPPVNNTIRYQKYKEAILKCAARKLYPTPSCSIERVVNLYQAFDVGMQSVLLGQQFIDGHPVVLDFDASKYCNN